ncbi:MAG: hypothetical protein U9Q22_05965 [Candidatus Altiarchaeota archaeon]|nr:hypothetical protein [Candidatus Altiarchaeota archaeon]
MESIKIQTPELDAEVLASFAERLNEVITDFREEMEILSNRKVMTQIIKTQKAKKEGKLVEFNSLDEFLEEIDRNEQI